MPPSDAHEDRAELARPKTAALFAGEPEALPVSALFFSPFVTFGLGILLGIFDCGETRVCTLKSFPSKKLELGLCSDTIVESDLDQSSLDDFDSNLYCKDLTSIWEREGSEREK
jgi:hypothetical protein